MKKLQVINRKFLPTSLPLTSTLVFWLALDHWNAPGWLYGIVAFIMVIAWIVAIIAIYKEEPADVIFNGGVCNGKNTTE